MFRTRYISRFRNDALLLLLSAAILVMPGIVRSQQGSPVEGPIAFIGHGAMFDKDGFEITPTAEFIREAQAFYMNQLLEMTDEDQRRRFEELKAELTQRRVLEGQTRLVADSRLIEWLIRTVEHEELDRLRGKNNLMMLELNMKLPVAPGYPRSLEPFELPDDLRERLIEADLAQTGTSDAILGIVTTADGQAHREPVKVLPRRQYPRPGPPAITPKQTRDPLLELKKNVAPGRQLNQFFNTRRFVGQNFTFEPS